MNAVGATVESQTNPTDSAAISTMTPGLGLPAGFSAPAHS